MFSGCKGVQRIESTYIFVSLVRFMLLHLKAVSAPTKSPSMWAGAAVPRVSCWVSTRQWPGSGFRYLELHARLALGPARRVYNMVIIVMHADTGREIYIRITSRSHITGAYLRKNLHILSLSIVPCTYTVVATA